MTLKEAIEVLKDRNAVNWKLIEGEETTDFGIFLMREMKAIEVVLKELER